MLNCQLSFLMVQYSLSKSASRQLYPINNYYWLSQTKYSGDIQANSPNKWKNIHSKLSQFAETEPDKELWNSHKRSPINILYFLSYSHTSEPFLHSLKWSISSFTRRSIVTLLLSYANQLRLWLRVKYLRFILFYWARLV